MIFREFQDLLRKLELFERLRNDMSFDKKFQSKFNDDNETFNLSV